MGKKYDIRLTEAAKAAALECEAEGKGIRFSPARSGCCSMAVTLYPDVERLKDAVIEVDGIRILTRDEYPEMDWIGTIDYKAKGLHKGFQFKFGR